jgi:hypothetical protein
MNPMHLKRRHPRFHAAATLAPKGPGSSLASSRHSCGSRRQVVGGADSRIGGSRLLATGQTLRARGPAPMKPSALRIERLLAKVEAENTLGIMGVAAFAAFLGKPPVFW